MGISHAAEMPAPAEGTAAAAALKANAERRVTRIDKMVKLHKRKPPTKVRKDGESAPVVVPGKLITRENDMYIMTIGMMLGLRVSLYYNATNADEEVAEQDFHSGDHYLFPPEGCSKPGLPQTPRHHLAHTFKFKDYAPKIFHRIRLLSGIDTKSYMDSVSGDANFVQFTSNSKR
jgi:1-phosphatidylinositol-4-phosphate 5-kinase